MTPVTWTVEITYREPTYELYRGETLGPWQWTWRGPAADASTARDTATLEFKRLSTLSGVGWERKIIAIETLNT